MSLISSRNNVETESTRLSSHCLSPSLREYSFEVLARTQTKHKNKKNEINFHSCGKSFAFGPPRRLVDWILIKSSSRSLHHRSCFESGHAPKNIKRRLRLCFLPRRRHWEWNRPPATTAAPAICPPPSQRTAFLSARLYTLTHHFILCMRKSRSFISPRRPESLGYLFTVAFSHAIHSLSVAWK